MAAVIKVRSNEWLVRNRTGQWTFKTHAEAQKKADECCAETLKSMLVSTEQKHGTA